MSSKPGPCRYNLGCCEVSSARVGALCHAPSRLKIVRKLNGSRIKKSSEKGTKNEDGAINIGKMNNAVTRCSDNCS